MFNAPASYLDSQIELQIENLSKNDFPSFNLAYNRMTEEQKEALLAAKYDLIVYVENYHEICRVVPTSKDRGELIDTHKTLGIKRIPPYTEEEINEEIDSKIKYELPIVLQYSRLTDVQIQNLLNSGYNIYIHKGNDDGVVTVKMKKELTPGTIIRLN